MHRNSTRRPIPHQTEAILPVSTASITFRTSGHANTLQARAGQTASGRHSWGTQHTEWVDSTLPVPKPNSTVSLCLDQKDLNKVIIRNQGHSWTMDDILPDLSHSSYHTPNDATSRFWHVSLDLQCSLLNTFNIPWDKFRWFRLCFGLKVSSNVFQQRLDKAISLLPGIIHIADDILTYGRSEIERDGRLITLLEAGWIGCPLFTTKGNSGPKTVNSLDTGRPHKAWKSIQIKSKP